MEHLIEIEQDNIGGEEVQTVDARRLHKFLEVQTAFKDWITRRIEEYGFNEGEDFCCSNLSSKPGQRGGHNRREYHVTLDMAKELSMVERTEKGREARRYFIECERIALGRSGAVASDADELSTVKDRVPLYHGAVDIVITHHLSFPTAYRALNWFAGVDGFPRMTKRQAAEAAGFVGRFLSGEATQRDFERIERNRAALHGEEPQLQLVGVTLSLPGSAKKRKGTH
ncbi:antA/AntB antirepressor family protein [Burkholderia gladioli]|uniref:antA/AntB antirepressor family protein n=1 Tax=Burkholderia gladioli TaxID=28095 RepID=UPI00163E9F72|nr:antA/AntB antirepressor family protein [Burkholderia gladioli]